MVVAQVRVRGPPGAAGRPGSLAAAAAAAGRGASVQRQVARPVRGRGRRHGRAAAVARAAPVVGQYVGDHEPGPAEMVQRHGARGRGGRQLVHRHRGRRRGRRSRGRPALVRVTVVRGHRSC